MAGPKYRLTIKRRDGDYQQTIGAGWAKSGPYGEFISISLQPGTVLSWRDTEDCFISLFENDDAPRGNNKQKGGEKKSYSEDLDDEIPF